MSKSKYKEDFPQLVEMYMRQGLTELQAAKNLGVSISTFTLYKTDNPAFLAAIKRGKAPVDFEVENALLKRALGYTYSEHKETVKVDGLETCDTLKEVVPDVTAQIFWLKNRNPGRWRDVKGVELTGKDGGPVEQKQTVSAPEIVEAVNALAKFL
jgi:transcriptional regulator with XRE-family HTH domain